MVEDEGSFAESIAFSLFLPSCFSRARKEDFSIYTNVAFLFFSSMLFTTSDLSDERKRQLSLGVQSQNASTQGNDTTRSRQNRCFFQRPKWTDFLPLSLFSFSHPLSLNHPLFGNTNSTRRSFCNTKSKYYFFPSVSSLRRSFPTLSTNFISPTISLLKESSTLRLVTRPEKYSKNLEYIKFS